MSILLADEAVRWTMHQNASMQMQMLIRSEEKKNEVKTECNFVG
jgi:hypothetical protein